MGKQNPTLGFPALGQGLFPALQCLCVYLATSRCKPSSSSTNQEKTLKYLPWPPNLLYLRQPPQDPFCSAHTLLTSKAQYLYSGRTYSPASWEEWEAQQSQKTLLLSGKVKGLPAGGHPAYSSLLLYQRAGQWGWCYLRNGGTCIGSYNILPVNPLQYLPAPQSFVQSGFECLKHQRSLSLDRSSKQPGNTLLKGSSCIAFAFFLLLLFNHLASLIQIVYPSMCF